MVDNSEHRKRPILVPTPPAPALENPLVSAAPQLLGSAKKVRHLETRDKIGTSLPPLTKKDFDFGGGSGSQYSATAIFYDSGRRHQQSLSSSSAVPISKTFGDFFSKFHGTTPTTAPSTTTITTPAIVMPGNSTTDLRSTSTVPTPPSSSPLVGAMSGELKASLELDTPMSHATHQKLSHSPLQSSPPLPMPSSQPSTSSPLLQPKKIAATPTISAITAVNSHDDFSLSTPQPSSSSSSPATTPPMPKKQSHSHFHLHPKRGNVITSTSTATTNSLMITSPQTSIMAPESSLAAWSSTQSSNTTHTLLTVYDRSTIMTASSSIFGGLGGVAGGARVRRRSSGDKSSAAASSVFMDIFARNVEKEVGGGE
ncbi:hypothetical protein HK100_010113, partial [Physocladia obscura]